MAFTFSFEGKFGKWLLGFIKGYPHEKYWRRRQYVVDATRGNILLKLYYLYWIKRVDARNLCSFGTNLNSGASFATPPHLPHGPNGIIVGHDVSIVSNVTIFQQVTISHGGQVADNVMIGAGAKILPGVKIGHYAKIGANAVVVGDVPPYATVVLPKPRIITPES